MLRPLTRWNPSRTPTSLRTMDPFTRLMDTFFRYEPWLGEELSERAWMPPMDIRETDSEYVVEAELPGMKKEDVEITLENNVLRLSGERKLDREHENDNFHRLERAYGKFARSFTLGSHVEADKVKANYRDGILTVTVPKTEGAKPKKIAIH